jgi:intracellular sulfur oxidation DsrE/DsrF family protein
MKETVLKQTAQRRGFLRGLGTGAAALGLAALTSAFKFTSSKEEGSKAIYKSKDPADLWFDKIKGDHRVVYDSPHPHEIFPFAWPKVFLVTNEATGSSEEDCGVVVVLRHASIGYAFKDNVWAKYNFGEVFEAGDIGPAFLAADAATAYKTRNPFYMTKPGDFAIPGFGAIPIGIPELQKSGVMFCVCNAAMTVYANVLAGKMGMKPEDVMNEWKAGLIPGVQIVPSGVWALGRAQEHGCKYIFAG